MERMAFYFQIAPKAPLFKVLTYKSFKQLEQGQRVKIPLGSREVYGLVLERDLQAVQHLGQNEGSF